MTTTRSGSRRRRGALVLAAAVAGALGWAGPALADGVTATPSEAARGDAVELHLVVPEERPGARTEKIEFRLPADAPIGEVYPLSVPGWAPLITTRKPTTRVEGIHGYSVDTVTASVIWTRAAGRPVPGPARLSIAMGPMPEVDRVAFEVVQTYSDGSVVRWADPAGGAHPAPALALRPAPPGAATGHEHGGVADPQVAAGPGTAAGGAAPGGAPADDPAPNADVLLGGGLLAGLGGGAVVGWAVSRRRRSGPTTPDRGDAPDTDEPAEARGWKFDGRTPPSTPADSAAADEGETGAPADPAPGRAEQAVGSR
ncbi:DUF1775 domain-containing protein [Micromonospora sp. NPDC000089]|uniref:DUF1775 domain-containing protein n=1 Tax=unclassified Micromonospora TaxID=2617518 RepID=UPI00369C78AD